MFIFYILSLPLVDEGRAGNIAYLDFSKAFDTVLHNILIEKLMKCGLDEHAVRWIKNWLNYQAQKVEQSLVRG